MKKKLLTNGNVFKRTDGRWDLSDKGILILIFQVKKKDFYSYYITCRISARRVIDNENNEGEIAA